MGAVWKAQYTPNRGSYADCFNVFHTVHRGFRVVFIDHKLRPSAFKIIGQKYQKRHLTPTIRVSIGDQFTVYHAATRPRTIGMLVEKVQKQGPKAGSESNCFPKAAQKQGQRAIVSNIGTLSGIILKLI